MAENDEYELLPKQEVENLKKEIERLRKHPFGELAEGKNILDAINNLNNSINKLINIFTKAEADLAKEYAGSSPVEDLKAIKEQNNEIAQGLVTVADMIKAASRPPSKPPTPEYGIPSLTSEPAPEFPGQIPSPPGTVPGLGAQGPPPPIEEPFPKKKRRGLFSRK